MSLRVECHILNGYGRANCRRKPANKLAATSVRSRPARFQVRFTKAAAPAAHRSSLDRREDEEWS